MQVQRPALTMEQGLKLRMCPQIIQSMKLMEMPIMDLRETIEEEAEKNPALEILEDKTTVSLDSAIASNRKEEDDYFETASDPGFVRRGGEEAAEEQHKFIEGVLTRPETLQEHLLWQLALEPVDAETRRVAEVLIQNLDSDGFNKEPVDTLFGAAPPPPERLRAAIALVQGLEPQGACTADYRESLEVQARLLPDAPEGLLDALPYLDLMDRNTTAGLEKKLHRGPEEVKIIIERIKELSPFPGRRFASSAQTRYVVPDVQVTRKEGEFVIILNDEEIPVLGINPFFMEIADTTRRNRPGAAKAAPSALSARNFVNENIKEARWFIQSINQRNHTLLRVSRAIVEFQRSFFVNGPKYVAPLTLKDIAGELGVHETTVSRAANGKYMQTEWGIFEIRHFFTNSISGPGSSGSRFSKEGVKEIIKEMIGQEERRFSDKEIAQMLAKRGINLARRTVAKYRGELDLGSSYRR